VTPRELAKLLASEIERRLALLADPSSDIKDVRAALHTIRGSAAMAGQVDLAMVIGHLSARLRAGDASAAAEAAQILSDALARLREGAPAFAARFPEPPPGLGASTLDPEHKSEYQAAVRERVEELTLVIDEDPRGADALERAVRAVHSIKGAAGAVGDDAMAWYCHGVEAQLKAALGQERDDAVLGGLSRHTSVIALLLEDPNAALATLRGTPRAALVRGGHG
jgi:chemotaxis protein histidine kinase CheA